MAKRRVLSVGQTILGGDYTIKSIIHEGKGMSNVYKVVDANLGKTWCMKEIVRSDAGKNKIEYRSLLNEAKIMSDLVDHPLIPRIKDMRVDEDIDSIVIIMDYIKGKSLAERMKELGRVLSEKETLSIMRDVLSVMKYLHNRPEPIFYRDLKPDNIVVLDDWTIRVLDFGISVKIDEDNKIQNEALGTKGYAAPEMKLKGVEYDLRGDIYSFGATMYSCLTGRKPPSDYSLDHLSPRVLNNKVSVVLDEVVQKCCSLDKEERYVSFNDLEFALNTMSSRDKKVRGRAKRRVFLTLMCLLVSIASLIGGIVVSSNKSAVLEEKYINAVTVAEKSGELQDFKKAISLKPNRIDPYFTMINRVKEDGLFSKEEEDIILGVISSNVASIEGDLRYLEFEYELGRLYWYYYSDNNDGITKAGRWLYDCQGLNEEATILYDISSFYTGLKSAVIEGKDDGMYKKAFDSLFKATEFEGDNVIILSVDKALLHCIKSYSYEMARDGVLKEDLLGVISKIGNDTKEIKSENERVLSLLDDIQSVIPQVKSSVEVAYR